MTSIIRNSNYQTTPKFKLLLQVDDPDLRVLYKEKVETWNKNLLNSKYTDSGFDLFMPNKVSFVSGTKTISYPLTQLVNLNVKAAVYTNTLYKEQSTPCAYTLNVRSSIYKTKFRLANNVGIIDSGYRGNLMAAVDCWDSTQTMEKLNRYFQICMPTLEPFIIELVETLDTTERGEGGHGSTGK